MTTQENSLEKREEIPIENVPHLNSSIFWVLLTVALLNLILGFFTIISVIIDTVTHNQFNYPDTVIIGFLLIIGGFILLGGTIIMRNWAPIPQIEPTDQPSDIKD